MLQEITIKIVTEQFNAEQSIRDAIVNAGFDISDLRSEIIEE